MAEIFGRPDMIKASDGGGGKSIRKNRERRRTPTMLIQGMFKHWLTQLGLTDESAGSPIFVMKPAWKFNSSQINTSMQSLCLVEIVLPSVEETPETIAIEDTFEKMERATVRLAKLSVMWVLERWNVRSICHGW
jgi:acetyl-CoA carboxylase/biotin carboxylase 1